MGLTAIIALPLGVGAAIYLEEYGERNRISPRHGPTVRGGGCAGQARCVIA